MNIRTADIDDAEAISKLMEQLGYPVSIDLIKQKIQQFTAGTVDHIYVAESEGIVVGSISCHITSLFHQAGASGRITSLAVDKKYRAQGIGKALVNQAEAYFRSCDCRKFEVTSSDRREDAHRFYLSCGYEVDERRFIKYC